MKYCCSKMKYYLNLRCQQHPSPFDCPDNVVIKTKKGEYGIIIHDGGPSYYKINYCPWCGKNLKEFK